MRLLAEVVGVLREQGIDHALIGAAAMAVHGVSRATVDVDLLTVDTKALQADLWTGFGAGNISVRVLKGDLSLTPHHGHRLKRIGGAAAAEVCRLAQP